MTDIYDYTEGVAVTVTSETTAQTQTYGRIVVDIEKCVGCRCCELACSLKNYGENCPARARIYVVRSVRDGIITNIPILCQQCEDPLCVAMCPAGALARHAETHAVVVDIDRCLGCRTCVEVCPFGGPSVDPRTGKSEKCTLCDGDPTCVKVCTQDAISFIAAEEESQHRKRVGTARYLDYLQSVVPSGE
jgi:anaerobic carbon-monoxide dehydrogenase iron sulfur subunit